MAVFIKKPIERKKKKGVKQVFPPLLIRSIEFEAKAEGYCGLISAVESQPPWGVSSQNADGHKTASLLLPEMLTSHWACPRGRRMTDLH